MEIKPPVAIDQIAEPTDRFRCEPYKSVILARACADRQAMSAKPRDQRTGDYVYCVGCPTGPRVLAQLKLVPPEQLVSEPANRRATVVRNGSKRGRPRKNAAAPKPPPAPSKATLDAVAAQPTALPMRPPGDGRRPKLRVPEPSEPPPPPGEPQRRDGPVIQPPAPEGPTAQDASPKPADPIDPGPEAQAADPLEDFTLEMQRIEEGLLGVEQKTKDLVKRLRALRARLGAKR